MIQAWVLREKGFKEFLNVEEDVRYCKRNTGKLKETKNKIKVRKMKVRLEWK